MRTKLILFAFIASYVFFSCSNEEDGEFGQPDDPWSNGVDTTLMDSSAYIGGKRFFTENFIMEYVSPSQEALRIRTIQQSGEISFWISASDINVISKVTTDGLRNGEEYDEYANFYGDTLYNGYVNPAAQFPEFAWGTLCMPLEGMEVIALTDYNDNYPASSSLTEIVTMRKMDLVEFINEGYKYPFDFYEPADIEKNRHVVRVEEISKENPIRLLSIGSGSGDFYISEKPTPGKHTIQVTLTFGADPVSGETVEPIVLECEFEYTLEEE